MGRQHRVRGRKKDKGPWSHAEEATRSCQQHLIGSPLFFIILEGNCNFVPLANGWPHCWFKLLNNLEVIGRVIWFLVIPSLSHPPSLLMIQDDWKTQCFRQKLGAISFFWWLSSCLNSCYLHQDSKENTNSRTDRLVEIMVWSSGVRKPSSSKVK